MTKILNQDHNVLVGHLLGREVDITFLSVGDIVTLHEQVISMFGGGAGVRDVALLESALHRPMQAACYEDMDAIRASTLLGEAIVRNHAFIDGNKRSGFFAMVTMLDENGYDFQADVADIVYMIKGLAANTIDSQAFTGWVRKHAVPYADQEQDLNSSRPKG